VIEDEPFIISLFISLIPRLANRIENMMRTIIEKHPPVAVLN
jgi:hypothetical protein